MRALEVWNGSLAAGGYFSHAGGVAAPHVALWNGATWSSPASGPSQQVLALAASGGNLVAGGTFASAGGMAAIGVAVWDGTAWQPLGTGINVSLGYVKALADFGGGLVAAGSFSTAGGVAASGIARWDGAAWQPLGAGLATVPAGIGPQGFALGVVDGGLVAGGMFTGAGTTAVSPLVARWASPLPLLRLAQPGGAGSGVVVTSSALVAGREYFNVASAALCPAGPGSGPVGGLCFPDPAPLLFQLQLPAGAAPIHWLATAPVMTFGPYALPPGLVFEAVCFDATGGVLGCLSPAVRYAVN